MRLELRLRDGRAGHYAFNVGALSGRGYEVQAEECGLDGIGKGPYFRLERGELKASSEATFPSVTPDRLALVSASGLSVFRRVFDALTAMRLYNLNPKLIRELQKPQDGRLLKPTGENIASVIGHLERMAPEAMALIHKQKGSEKQKVLEFIPRAYSPIVTSTSARYKVTPCTSPSPFFSRLLQTTLFSQVAAA